MDAYLERGLDRLREGDGPGAEAALADAELAPDAGGVHDARVAHLRAVAAHLRHDAEAAERLMSEALTATTDPTLVASLHNDLGNMRLEAGRPAAAIESYEASLAVQPADAPTWANLATARRHAGDPVGAGRTGLHVLELESGAALGRAAVGAAVVHLTGQGRTAEALELVRRWVELDPGHPGARHRLAALGGLPAPERAPDDYVETLFDASAEDFDDHLAGLGYRAPRLVVDRVAAVLGDAAGALDVADLGCGTGLVGDLVRPWARSLVGCDLSVGMLRRAQRRGCYDTLHRAELGAFLRARHAAYDLVVCADTLCYLGDLTEVARAAADALRPGGTLVATVERLDDDDADHDGSWRLTPTGRYAHSTGHLHAVAARAGLHDVSTSGVHLRLEADEPVEGLLWTARRPERSGDGPGQTTARAGARMDG